MTGSTKQEHLQTLEKVLTKLKDVGLSIFRASTCEKIKAIKMLKTLEMFSSDHLLVLPHLCLYKLLKKRSKVAMELKTINCLFLRLTAQQYN